MDNLPKPTSQFIAELTQLRERVAELEAANAAFHESETSWRHITDNMLDVVGLTDLHGVYQYVSPSVRNVTGHEPSQIVGQTMFEHIHPDDVFRMIRISMRALRAGQTGRMELRYQHADGHYVTLEAVGSPARDDTGRIIGAVISARDISARRQAEAALHDNEQLYQALVDALPQSLYRVDRTGRVIFANQATLATLGVPLEEYMGKSAYDFYPAGLAAKYRADDQRIIETGEMFTTIEEQVLPITGEHLYVEVIKMPVRLATGEITGIQGMFWDVTTRMRAENALRESEARLRRAESVAHFGNWEFRLAEDKVRASAGARLIYGLQGNEWSIAATQSIALPEYRPVLDAALTNLIEYGHPYDIEFRIRRPTDGQLRDIRSIAEYDAANHVVFGVINDITERKRAEEALHESELLYQSLVEVSPLSICRKDLAGRFTFANQRFMEVSNRSLADLIGRTDFDLHPPQLAEKYRRDDQAVIDSGQAQEFIEERAVLEGETTVIQSYKTPIYDATGKITGIQVSFWDITARQRAEQAERDQHELADSLREVALLLNSTLDYSAVIDQMLLNIGRVVPHTTANVMLIDEAAGLAHVIRARGYGQVSPELAQQVLDFSLPVTLSNLRRMIDTRQPVIINDTHAAPDWVVTPETAWTRSYLGAPIVLREQTLGIFNLDSDQPHFFTAEHAQRLMAFAAQAAAAIENARLFEAERDARQLAEALRDTAAALSHSLNPDEVLDQVLDLVERVTPCDGANLMLVSGDLARVIRVRGQCPPHSIGAEEYAIETLDNLRLMRNTGRPCIIEHTRDNPQWHTLPGPEWVASYAGVPIRVHGEVLGFLGLYSAQPGYFSGRHADRLAAFADQIALAVHNAQLHASIQRHAAELEERVRQRTSELTTANDQLAAANAQLTQLDQLKDQFISRISHELRTPLTNIKIYLELLDTGKHEKRAKYMSTLTAQTSRLQELIEDLLEVSQLDMEHLVFTLRPCNLNHVAADLLNDQRSQAQQRDLTLAADLQPDLPAALGDSSLVFQAATRLMVNALVYTPAGGRVTVITRQQSRADSNWITLTVQDTGPGISAKDLPHLFERFYRGEAASDYTVPGTGLGLSISQSIIGKMNGRITVDDEPGAGAAFTIWLPAAQ